MDKALVSLKDFSFKNSKYSLLLLHYYVPPKHTHARTHSYKRTQNTISVFSGGVGFVNKTINSASNRAHKRARARTRENARNSPRFCFTHALVPGKTPGTPALRAET